MSKIIDWLRNIFFRKEEERANLETELKEIKKTAIPKIKKQKKLRKRKTKKTRKFLKPPHVIKKSEPFRKKIVKKKMPMRPVPKIQPYKIPHEPKKIIEIGKMPKEILKEVIIADIMTKNPVVVRVSDPLSYVVRLFSEKGISGAPVVHDSNFIGIISESDIVKTIGIKDMLNINGIGLKRLGEIKVEEIMHRDPIFVYEYTKLSDAADLMNKHDIARLPVLNEKRDIVGIVTRSDIVRGVSKELLLRILKKRPQEERIRLKVETDIDEVLKIVERKGSINTDEIQHKLMLPEDKIEEWGKILEKHELVEVFYPPFGKPELRKKLK